MKNTRNSTKSHSSRVSGFPNSTRFFGLSSRCSSVAGEKPKQPVAASVPPVKVTQVMQQDVPIVQEWVGTLDGMVNAKLMPRLPVI